MKFFQMFIAVWGSLAAQVALSQEAMSAMSQTVSAGQQLQVKGNSPIVDLLMRGTLLGSEWVLWLLLILSVVSGAVCIERFLYYRSTNLTFSDFIKKLTEHLNENNIKKAEEFCNEHSALESDVALVALKNADKGKTAIEKSMSSFVAAEKAKLDKGLVFLGTLGNNAPFIGLFGTVLGIIQAFNDLAQNPAGGPSVVMAGISEALVATAVGLFVAIPAVIAFNTFQRIVKRKLLNAESIQDLMIKHFSDSSTEKKAA